MRIELPGDSLVKVGVNFDVLANLLLLRVLSVQFHGYLFVLHGDAVDLPDWSL